MKWSEPLTFSNGHGQFFAGQQDQWFFREPGKAFRKFVGEFDCHMTGDLFVISATGIARSEPETLDSLYHMGGLYSRDLSYVPFDF